MDVVDYLIERSASILVRASDGKTPQSMLKALNHKAPSRKRELVSPTPSFVCPGAATRSRFAQWEWAGAQEETEPLIEKKEDNVLVENQQYLSRQVSNGCQTNRYANPQEQDHKNKNKYNSKIARTGRIRRKPPTTKNTINKDTKSSNKSDNHSNDNKYNNNNEQHDDTTTPPPHHHHHHH